MFSILLVTLMAGPPEVTPGKPGEAVTYATTVTVAVGEVAFVNGKGKWEKLPDSPGTLIKIGETGVAFVSPTKGTFPLICYSVDGIAFVKVVVGEAVVPPVPVNDDLKDKLIAAAKKDNDKASIIQLSAFYSAEVGQKIAADTKNATVKDVMAKVRVSAVLDTAKVPNVRAAIGAQLAAQFKPDAPLTPETRAALVSLFAKIENILDFLSN